MRARLIDGADEVYKMVLHHCIKKEGLDFWSRNMTED